MNHFSNHKKTPRQLLDTFIYGSLLVLLVCLIVTAFVFSATYLKKERARSEISREQLIHFFDFQYRAMTEEMWTQNYEAINFRVADIAKQLGQATHEVVLADEQGNCIFTTLGSGPCELPLDFRATIPNLNSRSTKPILHFNQSTNHYMYMAPLSVGAVLKGYLYAEISDPYEFYRGGNIALATSTFIIPIACVIFIWLVWLLLSQRTILKPYLSSLVEMEKERAVGVLAAQVAHDIRSPLVALKSAIDGFKGLDESQRRMITAAGGRIESIANALITKFTGKDNEESPSCFLHAVVDSIVAEKRAVFGENSRIEINTELPIDYRRAHVSISTIEMARVLSNLVNNSIDALSECLKGHIKISVFAEYGRAYLVVEDDGKGIDSESLHKIRTVGGTYGKVGGSGMGFRHAKATLAKVNGNLQIESTLGKGTKVTIDLPVVPLPNWCADRIDLHEVDTVVVLDDDPSMLLIWKQRLGEKKAVYLNDPSQFDYANFTRERTKYIFDHEIGKSSTTGLDLIIRHKLGDSAVLVTSHFGDQGVQRSIELHGAKMLPKFMAASAKILGLEQKFDANSFDLVLIDDDIFVHDLWNFESGQEGKLLKAVTSVGELDLEQLDKRTPIYVDKNLGSECGLRVATDLHERGFVNIRLSSGENLDGITIPSFIREVRSKDFPMGISVRA